MGRTLADIERGLQRGTHTLTMANSREYAPHLHFRRGYHVLDGEHTAEIFRKKMKEAAAGGVPVSDQMVELTLEATGFEEVSYQRSLTDELRPAVPRNKSERERGVSVEGRERNAHPGHWGDISGNLANSYKAYVNGDLKVPEAS